MAALVARSRLLAACGKKGPPLAPLNMAPEAPSAVIARRLGDTVFIGMKVPSKSALGTGPYSIDHLEVYAVTLAPGAVTPPNRDLLKPEHVIAKIPIAPPPDPEAPEPDTPAEAAAARRRRDVCRKAHARGASAAGDYQAAEGGEGRQAAAAGACTAAGRRTRRAGRSGRAAAADRTAGVDAVVCRRWECRRTTIRALASARVEVPLLSAPAPARAGATPATWDQTSVTVSWRPPASTSDEAPGVLYNVYARPGRRIRIRPARRSRRRRRSIRRRSTC